MSPSGGGAYRSSGRSPQQSRSFRARSDAAHGCDPCFVRDKQFFRDRQFFRHKHFFRTYFGSYFGTDFSTDFSSLGGRLGPAGLGPAGLGPAGDAIRGGGVRSDGPVWRRQSCGEFAGATVCQFLGQCAGGIGPVQCLWDTDATWDTDVSWDTDAAWDTDATGNAVGQRGGSRFR